MLVPRGEDLGQLCTTLLGSVDAQAGRKRDVQGRTVLDKFAEEQALFRALPARCFEPRQVLVVRPNRKALVRVKGAQYSLPSHWNLLDVTAYVGPTDVPFMCRDEVAVRPRVAAKQQHIQYTDYLCELSRKPQAVRQVAPELLEELSAPFGQLWQLLTDSYGGREAGRIFAKLLRAVVEHGEEQVGVALRKVLDGGKGHLLELGTLLRQPLPKEVEVPAALRHYVVEAPRAADFDHLLHQEVTP